MIIILLLLLAWSTSKLATLNDKFAAMKLTCSSFEHGLKTSGVLLYCLNLQGSGYYTVAEVERNIANLQWVEHDKTWQVVEKKSNSAWSASFDAIKII